MDAPKEHLRIKKNKGITHLNCSVNGYHFIDEDTKMHMIYVPALEISGYGDSIEEADNMVYTSIKDLCKEFVKLSLKDLGADLTRLGWAKEKLHSKIFKPNFNTEEVLKEDGIENYQLKEFNLAA